MEAQPNQRQARKRSKPSRTVYIAFNQDLNGSRNFENVKDAQEWIEDQGWEKANILRRSQRYEKGWKDLDAEYVRQDFEHPFFSEITGGIL